MHSQHLGGSLPFGPLAALAGPLHKQSRDVGLRAGAEAADRAEGLPCPGGQVPGLPAPREGSEGVGRGGPGQGADLGLVNPVGLLGAAERPWGRLLGSSAGPEFLHLPRSRGKSSERRVLFSLRLSSAP